MSPRMVCALYSERAGWAAPQDGGTLWRRKQSAADKSQGKKRAGNGAGNKLKNSSKGAVMKLGQNVTMQVDAISIKQHSLDMALGIGGLLPRAYRQRFIDRKRRQNEKARFIDVNTLTPYAKALRYRQPSSASRTRASRC